MSAITKSETNKAVQSYHRQTWNDPVKWIRDALGVKLWSKQADVARAVRKHQRTAARSSHAVGKSYVAAALALWFLHSHCPSYVIITGASWQSIRKTIFPIMRTMIRDAPYDVMMGGRVLDTQLQLGDQWGCFGISPDEAENMAGYRTSEGVFVIMDEASGLEDGFYDAIVALVLGPRSRALAIGNPLRPEGRFFEMFQSEDWHKIHISAFDSPNVVEGREVIKGLADIEWIDGRRKDYGEGTPAWAARVLGEFPEIAEDVLIPMAWVEAATRDVITTRHDADLILGVDVARFGSDQTVFIIRDDREIKSIQSFSGQNLMETTGRIVDIIKHGGVMAGNVMVDDSGLGGGVTDRLQELGYDITPINFGGKADDPECFLNKRAEMYWCLRESLKPDALNPLIIPMKFGQHLCELSWIRYQYTSRGQIKLEDKAQIKKRHHGQSPDHGDALALTYATDSEVENFVV